MCQDRTIRQGAILAAQGSPTLSTNFDETRAEDMAYHPANRWRLGRPLGKLTRLLVITDLRAIAFFKPQVVLRTSTTSSKRNLSAHQAAIFWQLSAQRRHASMHSRISPIRSQSAAHCSQITAHWRQVSL
jgi:hypothetical protein